MAEQDSHSSGRPLNYCYFGASFLKGPFAGGPLSLAGASSLCNTRRNSLRRRPGRLLIRAAWLADSQLANRKRASFFGSLLYPPCFGEAG